MRRRLRWVLVLAGLAPLVAVGAEVLWPRADRVTEEGFYRIRAGMSRLDVEQILGQAGDYSTGPTSTVGDWKSVVLCESEYQLPLPAQRWQTDRVEIVVMYGTSDTAVAEVYFNMERIAQGPLEHALWQAKRLWRRWFPAG